MNNDPTYQQPLCSPCATCEESNTTTTRKQDENETKTTANDAVRCVPQFRFPEFQNAGEWLPITLKDIGKTYNGLSGKSGGDFGTGEPYVAYKQVFNGTTIKIEDCPLVAIKEGEKQNKLKKGDILVTISSETAQEIGMVNVITEDFKRSVYLNSFCFIFRPYNNCFIPSFAKYLFSSPSYRKQIISIAQGITRYNLSKDNFLKLTLFIPNLEEQQKIASCLLSIDEDISATTQKLEQLKTHKKTLLQKLFPQRGKTIPEFRFPEFATVSEWNKKKLGDVADVVQGYGFPERMQGKSKGEYPFIKVSDISAAVNKGSRLIDESVNYVDINDLETLRAIPFPQGTIIFAKIGEAIRLNRRVILNRESLIDNNIAGVKARSNVILDDYLYYVMLGIDLIKYAGGVVPSVKKSTIEGIEILLPQTLAEQQKITYCMQSIDDDIFATIKRLELLRTQKKALMQQLFVK